uniref:protein crumbs homolog 1-like n=1 Tax=Myxine glutinosa TaxID=7769 RepID=UPI00358E66E0
MPATTRLLFAGDTTHLFSYFFSAPIAHSTGQMIAMDFKIPVPVLSRHDNGADMPIMAAFCNTEPQRPNAVRGRVALVHKGLYGLREKKRARVDRAGEGTSSGAIYIIMVSTSFQARKAIWHVSWCILLGAAGIPRFTAAENSSFFILPFNTSLNLTESSHSNSTHPRGELSPSSRNISQVFNNNSMDHPEIPTTATFYNSHAAADHFNTDHNAASGSTNPKSDQSGIMDKITFDNHTDNKIKLRNASLDLCNPSPCLNGAECRLAPHGYQCYCVPGFQGAHCHVEIDECASYPCQNGATCLNKRDRYSCVCPRGFEGSNCELQSEPCSQTFCQNGGACEWAEQAGNMTLACYCTPHRNGSSCFPIGTMSFNGRNILTMNVTTSGTEQRSSNDTKHRRLFASNITLSLRFRTSFPFGQLLVLGRPDYHLGLKLVGGYVFTSIGSLHPQLCCSNSTIARDDGAWHHLELSIYHETMKLRLSGEDIQVLLLPDGSDFIEASEFLFLGGLPLSSSGTDRASGDHFIGCFQDVQLQGLIVTNRTSESPPLSVGVGCEQPVPCQNMFCGDQNKCKESENWSKCKCDGPYTSKECTQEFLTLGFPEMTSQNHTPYILLALQEDMGQLITLSFIMWPEKSRGLLLALLPSHDSQTSLTLWLEDNTVWLQTHPSTRLQAEISDDLIGRLGSRPIFVRLVFHAAQFFIFLDGHLAVQGYLKAVTILPGYQILFGAHEGLSKEVAQATLPIEAAVPFQGCLQDFRLNGRSLALDGILEGPAYIPKVNVTILKAQGLVTECPGSLTCRNIPCVHRKNCTWNGMALVCQCSHGWQGKECDQPIWCLHEPCPDDAQCRALPNGFECLSDTAVHSIPSAYEVLLNTSRQLTMSLELQTLRDNLTVAVVYMRVGTATLDIVVGRLCFRIQKGNITTTLFEVPKIVSDGHWHTVTVGAVLMEDAFATEWQMHFDGAEFSKYIDGVHCSLIHNGSQLFFGGKSLIEKENSTRLTDACVRNIHVSGLAVPLFEDSKLRWPRPQAERWLQRKRPKLPQCSHQDDWVCLTNHCYNGGTCIVNSGVLASCVCPMNMTGKQCETDSIQNMCDGNHTCATAGRCVPGVYRTSCDCLSRCNISDNICAPSSCLNEEKCTTSSNTFLCICDGGLTSTHCTTHREQNLAPQLAGLDLLIALLVGAAGLLLVLVLLVFVTVARRKRASQGGYNPSRQEKEGARVEMWNVMQAPPIERLI